VHALLGQCRPITYALTFQDPSFDTRESENETLSLKQILCKEGNGTLYQYIAVHLLQKKGTPHLMKPYTLLATCPEGIEPPAHAAYGICLKEVEPLNLSPGSD